MAKNHELGIESSMDGTDSGKGDGVGADLDMQAKEEERAASMLKGRPVWSERREAVHDCIRVKGV